MLRALLLAIPLAAVGSEVGSKNCAPCHAQIARAYLATPMAQSSGVAGAGAFRESFEHANFTSPGGSVRYRVSRDPRGFSFNFDQGGLEGNRRLDYYIGSGSVGRSYLSLIGNFLFQAPVSYYSSVARWDVSPGYEKSEDINLIRGVETSCLKCHASRVQSVEGTVNGYASPPFLEGGVSCERCHGPGETHLARMKSGSKAGGTAIVNPAKLDPVRRDSVCAQCHLSGEVEIAKAGAGAFRAGDVLSDYVSVFVRSGADRAMPVISHYQRMTQSACWKAAEGKLWCGTCHDPHTLPPADKKTAYFRDRCFQCHTDASCKAPAASRAGASNGCIACHMPRSEVTTVQHAVFTDHSIPRVPRAAPGGGIPSNFDLTAFGGAPAEDRELGLAYASVALRDNNRVWGMRAFELLRKEYSRHPEDLKVGGQLAQMYDRMGDERKACDIYALIVAADPASVVPAVNLGTCLAKQGRIQESIRLWKGALQRNPALESARLNLAVALYREGDLPGARATLNEALVFNPASRRIRELLQEMSR
ncbi:MAG: tetratricopeptide repeat protein [Bryobacteraceae bacterium]